MKCIKGPSGDIKRVHDNVANKMVNNEGYKYIPKSIWKEVTRPNKNKERND